MIYNGRELTFQQECFLKEINLRGMCMVMSADMEALLLKIILYCIVDDPNATIRRFKGMMMGSKIEMAEKDLKQYHPEEYTKYEDDFKIMCVSTPYFRQLFLEFDHFLKGSFSIHKV